MRYFLTAPAMEDGTDIEAEIESMEGDDLLYYLVEKAMRYTLIDAADGAEHTYRIYDDDGNHITSVSMHTLARNGQEYGLKMKYVYAAAYADMGL